MSPNPEAIAERMAIGLSDGRNRLGSSIMTRTSERQSLTREEKFVALVHLYLELRLPFDAALDAAEADLFARSEERRERHRTGLGMSPD
jgi:hypothetical protein